MSTLLDISVEGMVSKELRRETRASSVYAELKEDIIAGKLKPGSKLRLHDLNEHYNIGNSPLREALNRLCANGMVCQIENKGFSVSPISLDELEDIVKVRCLLEEIALRESITNDDDAYYERVVLIAFRLSRAAQNSNAISYNSDRHDLHLDFHQTILSGCGSNFIIKYCMSLYEQTQRYSNLTINEKCRADHEEKDHQAICDAILDKNVDKAIQLLRSHYQVTVDQIIKNDCLQ